MSSLTITFTVICIHLTNHSKTPQSALLDELDDILNPTSTIAVTVMATAACCTYRSSADPDLQRVVAEAG
jgi:hypothetical protein